MLRWVAVVVCLGIACSDSKASPGSSAPATEQPAAACAPDESAPPVPRDSYNTWTKVELPGTYCSDGSQYKFFTQYSQTTNNVLVLFEFGASCWDYDSCTHCGLSTFCESAKLKGYTNNAGIDDSHMGSYGDYYPTIVSLLGSDAPFADWNKVYLPYCTGDMQMGSRVATYASADGSDQLEYQHVGHTNIVAVSGWIDAQFKTVPRLVVTGSSSGGTAALVNYSLLRSRIHGAQCGYLLNDSGPLFSSAGASGPLHAALRDAYDVEPWLTMLGSDLGRDAEAAVRKDFGALTTVLAKAYPSDRLSTVLFQRDLNYLFFSYDSVTPGSPYAALADDWQADLDAFRTQQASRPNLAYYMPYFRLDNCSHCATLPPTQHLTELVSGQVSPWFGTEIAEDGSDATVFIHELLNDAAPLSSHFEQAHTDGEYGDAAIMECRELGITRMMPNP